MKTPYTLLSWSVVGLAISALAATNPVSSAQEPQAAPPLVTVTPQAAPAKEAPKQTFSLKPTGVMKDVQKLTESGADPAVVKAFVESWSTPYTVSADDILRMHAAGVSSEVLTALIRRSGQLAGSIQPSSPAPAVMAGPAQEPGPMQPPAVIYPYPESPGPEYTPAAATEYPAPTYIYNSYPQYTPYYSPWYGYSYFSYWPSFFYGGRFGYYHHYPYYSRYPYYNRYPYGHYGGGYHPYYRGNQGFVGHSYPVSHSFGYNHGFVQHQGFGGRPGMGFGGGHSFGGHAGGGHGGGGYRR